MEIETPVLLAHAIEDSTDIFRISGRGVFEHPKPPLGTPLFERLAVKRVLYYLHSSVPNAR